MRKTKLVLSTGRGTDRLTVRVEDEISGTSIVSFELDPDTVWRFLGGSHVEIDGMITEHFDRVGKTMRTDSVVYDRKALSASTYDQQLDDAEQLARADRPGWETYSPRRTNTGVVHVTLRRWE